MTFSDGSSVKCTPEHKFMLEDGSFEEIQNISIKQRLKTVSGKEIYIQRKSKIVFLENIPVYDLEIESVHNFPILNGIVVHNSKDMADSLAGALFNASIHKQDLVDNRQLFSVAADINMEADPQQEFLDDMTDSLLANTKMKSASKIASDKLDDLLNSFGMDNIISF